jgi:uncharacterized protein (DUF58 family)
MSSEHKPEIRLNLRLLPAMAATLAVLYAVTGYDGWLSLCVGLGGAWLLAWVWVRSLAVGLSLQRRVRLAYAAVGESLHEELKLHNRSWLPATWVEIIDQSEMLAEPVRLISDVEAHSIRTRYPIHLAQRRGLYTFGPTLVTTGDPFGVYNLTMRSDDSSSVLVMPPLLAMNWLYVAPGGWIGDLRRSRQALPRQISDAGVRNYQPGDSMRRVHWPASAHHAELMVRQMEALASDDWWLFVDLQQDVQAGAGLDLTLELAIVAAASLAVRGLREHRRVGLVLAGPKVTWLPPRADSSHRWRLMQALATAQPGRRSLADLLAMAGPEAGRAASWLVVTPSLDPAWAGIALRRGRGASLIALLIDPAEFGGGDGSAGLAKALMGQGIDVARLPRSMLAEAYPELGGAGRLEPGERYLRRPGAEWQRLR